MHEQVKAYIGSVRELLETEGPRLLSEESKVRLLAFLAEVGRREPDPKEFLSALRTAIGGVGIRNWRSAEREGGVSLDREGYLVRWTPIDEEARWAPVFVPAVTTAVDGPPREDETGCITQRRYTRMKWDGCSREKALEVSVGVHIRYSDSPPFEFMDHHFTLEEFRAAGGSVIERGEKSKVVQDGGGYPYGMRYLPYVGNMKPEFREVTEEEAEAILARPVEVRRQFIRGPVDPKPATPEELFLPEFPATPSGAFVAAHVSEEAQYTPPDPDKLVGPMVIIRLDPLPPSPVDLFLMRHMRSDGCTSAIPGARADWAPSEVVTYEPDLGEDLEISTEEERAWRAKR